MKDNFECPTCQEAFLYRPAPNTLRAIEDTEFRIGHACLVLVDCPHCPSYLLLDCDQGHAEVAGPNAKDGFSARGVFYDLTLSEKVKAEVNRLIASGHALMTADVQRAANSFRKALSIRKHDPIAWYNLGVAWSSMRNFGEAAGCFRHALRFDPTMINAWNNLGAVLSQSGMISESIAAFQSGLAVDPTYPKFYFGLATIAMGIGDFAEARALLQRALAVDPVYQPAKVNLAALDSLERKAGTNRPGLLNSLLSKFK